MYVRLELAIKTALRLLWYLRGYLLFHRLVAVALSAGVGRNVRVGSGTQVLPRAGLWPQGKSIRIGRSSYINRGCWLGGEIEMGDHCLLGPGVKIIAHQHVFDDPHRPVLDQGSLHEAIRIGTDVYMGANVTVLKGVTIGDGAVIGAGAVVTRHVPPFAIVAGVPARVIGVRGRGGEHPAARALGPVDA